MPMRTIPRRRSWSRLSALALLGLTSGLVSCSQIEPVTPVDEPITDPTQLYMGLTLDHPAINLSTAPGYNTIQLTATPRDALGNPIPGLPAPTYLSKDPAAVTVTAEGLVTAVGTATGAMVIASLTVGPVTQVDTALINVTNEASPPQLASLSLDPVLPDSAVRWMDKVPDPQTEDGNFVYSLAYYISQTYTGRRAMKLRVADATGTPITGLMIEYTSLDPAVLTLDSRWLSSDSDFDNFVFHHPGSVRMVARTTAYGIVKADTATFTVRLPIAQTVVIDPRATTGTPAFVPFEVRLPVYGMVSWANYLSDAVDITFDDPSDMTPPPTPMCNVISDDASFGFWGPGSSCGVGDALIPGILPPFPGEPPIPSIQVRQFTVPGVYPYRSTRTGLTGRVVVVADSP